MTLCKNLSRLTDPLSLTLAQVNNNTTLVPLPSEAKPYPAKLGRIFEGGHIFERLWYVV